MKIFFSGRFRSVLITIAAVGLLASLFVASPAEAASKTVYVATNGNDSNSGLSATSPKLTIAAGVSAASAGDTVSVAPGTYNGNVIINHGGSSSGYITVKSQTKYGAVVNGNGNTTNQAAIEINSEYIRIQDFSITGVLGVREGVIVNANNIQIVGNQIYNICQFLTGGTSWQGGAGIDIWKSKTSNLLFDSNIIHNIGAPGSTEQLVQGMYLSSQVTNGRVTNNVIYSVEDFGLHPYPTNKTSGWQLINNTVANTGRGILQASNGITRNNIVYNTRGAQYDIRGKGNVVDHNIAGGTGTGVLGTSTGVTIADPMFVDAANNDYHVKTGSPAIDRGSPTGAPTLDIAGVARPQGAGFDIGAYEQ